MLPGRTLRGSNLDDLKAELCHESDHTLVRKVMYMLERLVVLKIFPLHIVRLDRDRDRYMFGHSKNAHDLIKVRDMLKHVPKCNEIVGVFSDTGDRDRHNIISIDEDPRRSEGLKEATPRAEVEGRLWPRLVYEVPSDLTYMLGRL